MSAEHPADPELRALLAIAREASRLAGEVIMPLYDSVLTVELKADRTPVTLADRNAEEALRRFLERECPGHGILGEEFGERAGDGRYRWILDPIDGTQSFIRHVPLFGTLVALEREGEPVVGVIGCHAVGETAYAAKGMGAFINERPTRVSEARELRDSLVLGPSASTMHRTRPAVLQALLANARIQSWCDCYGYLMVAAGRADAMIDPEMSIWDAAALYPVITEAGGRMTTWEGEDRVGDSVIATNGLLHQAMLAVVQTTA
ncbi:MAG: histidinol phosphate phosphatase [Anaerolinea sp.]|nr:histidinol phosphate phosphatase [Anaerolinea sp.]